MTRQTIDDGKHSDGVKWNSGPPQVFRDVHINFRFVLSSPRDLTSDDDDRKPTGHAPMLCVALNTAHFAGRRSSCWRRRSKRPERAS